jgi:hypothetical protein
MNFMNTSIHVTESAAAELLGIREAEVSRLRRRFLVEGAGWKKEGGDLIEITPDGLQSLAKAISQKKKGQVKAVVALVPDVAGRDLVVDATCPNPRILMAHYVAEDGAVKRVRCRVRSSGLFVRGMAIPGCREISETLYAYEGRLPRGKGRWG